MKLFALYLKFYKDKIKTIDNWKDILGNIDYDYIDVYIWIFDSLIYHNNVINIFEDETLNIIMNKYPRCIFVSNCNENKYLTINEREYLKLIYEKDTMFFDPLWKGHANSHLKAFMIPKNVEYIFNLDADDMFYPNFKISYFYDCIRTLKKENLKIITRPFWICRNHGWSFGFTLATKDILEYMDILNYINTTNTFQEGPFKDRYNVKNLDNLFGEIFSSRQIPPQKLFFKLKDYDWSPPQNNGCYIENEYIINNNCLIIPHDEDTNSFG